MFLRSDGLRGVRGDLVGWLEFVCSTRTNDLAHCTETSFRWYNLPMEFYNQAICCKVVTFKQRLPYPNQARFKNELLSALPNEGGWGPCVRVQSHYRKIPPSS